MSNVHTGEKNDNFSKDDIVATNQIIDALITCKKMLRTQKKGEIYSVRTQNGIMCFVHKIKYVSMNHIPSDFGMFGIV